MLALNCSNVCKRKYLGEPSANENTAAENFGPGMNSKILHVETPDSDSEAYL